MHVAIVGAGVLGRIYGVRLAKAGTDVSFVVRASRLARVEPFHIEQVNGGGRRDSLDEPRRAAEIPSGAEVVLVAVRYHELEPGAGELAELLRKGAGASAPVVILTPMMPAQQRALEDAAGLRVVPAMPGVVGYLNDAGVVRYWIPAPTPTLIDDASASATPAEGRRATLEALAQSLTRAGVPTHLERDVAAINTATTTAFYPLIAAIDAGSGVDGVLGNKELLRAALDAAKECSTLARKAGKPATWASMLTKFVGPFTLKPGVALARRLFPEAVQFVDHHFGAKLHEQHVAMGEAILALGRQHGMSMPALTRFVSILRARPASP